MEKSLKFAFGFLFSLLILIANASAYASYERCNRYDKNCDNEKVIYVGYGYYLDEWENEDRYPLYDYRWGYSYRTSYEYQQNRYTRERFDYADNYRYNLRVYDEKPVTKYVYVDYLRTYEKRECYVNPPANKLFYIKC